jgi:hypothetical protein
MTFFMSRYLTGASAGGEPHSAGLLVYGLSSHAVVSVSGLSNSCSSCNSLVSGGGGVSCGSSVLGGFGGGGGVSCGGSVLSGGGGLGVSGACVFSAGGGGYHLSSGALNFDLKQTAVAQNLTQELIAWDVRRRALYSNAHEAAHVYDDAIFSQRRFWRFYREVDRYADKLGGSIFPLQANFREDDFFGLIEKSQLSARQIEAILESVISSLEECQGDSFKLVYAVRETIRREIERLADRGALIISETALSTVECIRDRILSLSIRTGNSPPAGATRRPAGRKALSELTALQVKNHETICRQENGSHLPYPIWQGCAPAHLCRRPRGYAAACSLSQPPRHRRYWPNRPMAKRAGTLRPSYRKQVVRHISMVG